MHDDFQAPYVGASDTSRERAVYEDSQGITRWRWNNILELLHERGDTGYTWSELSDITGWHHGQISGALSKLHEKGEIVQLHRKRNRSHVYVHRAYMDGLTEPYNLQPVKTRQSARADHLETIAELAHQLCYSQSKNIGMRWDALRAALKELETL